MSDLRSIFFILPIVLSACVNSPPAAHHVRHRPSRVHRHVKAVPLPKPIPAIQKTEKTAPVQIVISSPRKENNMNISWGTFFTGGMLVFLINAGITLVVWERLGVRSTVLAMAAKIPFLNKLLGLA